MEDPKHEEPADAPSCGGERQSEKGFAFEVALPWKNGGKHSLSYHSDYTSQDQPEHDRLK